MYRDGDTDDELLEGIDKMNQSRRYLNEAFGFTNFT